MRCISGMKGNVSMSTHSSISQRRNRGRRLHGSTFVVLLIALLLSRVSISSTLASSHQDSRVPQQQDLARAGVSVVRLLVSYTQPDQAANRSNPTAIAQCTGLGVLVGSGVNAKDKQQENWVLTDRS